MRIVGLCVKRAHAHTHAHTSLLNAVGHPKFRGPGGNAREMFNLTSEQLSRAKPAEAHDGPTMDLTHCETQAKRSSSRAVLPQAQNIDKSAHDERSFSVNQSLVSAETDDSEKSHYTTFHSIANSSTFHTDSSDSHHIKKFSHAGHVDYENQDTFMSKTGARTRTVDDSSESSAKPDGLKSEQIHDDESGHKTKINKAENAQSKTRSATMLDTQEQQTEKQEAKTDRKTRSLRPRSHSQPNLNANATEQRRRKGSKDIYEEEDTKTNTKKPKSKEKRPRTFKHSTTPEGTTLGPTSAHVHLDPVANHCSSQHISSHDPFDSVMEGHNARGISNFTSSHFSPIPPVGTTSGPTFAHSHADYIANRSSLQSVLSHDHIVAGNAHDERSFCNIQHDFNHERTVVGTTCFPHAGSIAECTHSQPVSSQDQFCQQKRS